MVRVGRSADQFQLRLPDGMRDILKEAAERNGRSLNAEIVARLQQTMFLESAGLLQAETTPVDLVRPVTGEQIVKMVRTMKNTLEELASWVEGDDRKQLRAEVREYIARENESLQDGETERRPAEKKPE